jgi:hypothetical protein
MAALRDDFKLPVRRGDQPKKPSKRSASFVVEEVPKTDQRTYQEREKVREMKLAVATKLGFTVREESPGAGPG